MKARIAFYVAAVVALVLFLAVVPSHATQHRDPALQDTAQKAPSSSPKPITSAGSTDSSAAKHADADKTTAKKSANSPAKGNKRSGSSRSAK
jgi:hypothetical protein